MGIGRADPSLRSIHRGYYHDDTKYDTTTTVGFGNGKRRNLNGKRLREARNHRPFKLRR